jgi:hypothetical protein
MPARQRFVECAFTRMQLMIFTSLMLTEANYMLRPLNY